ncbi:hypothetical protein [Ruegeria meonggei]|uniref:hypothetical protein n=1 Tax=Ruegeria meonggei TaxID=1446476 RepID=UPI00366BE5F9
MTHWTFVAAVWYLIAGAFLWKLIFHRDVSTLEKTNCQTHEEFQMLAEDQQFLQSGDQSGNPAILVCKAVFVAAWLTFLLFGFINARVFGN